MNLDILKRADYSRFAKCEHHEFDEQVVENLSFTPAQMMEMAEKGIPISNNTIGLTFIDGDTSNTSELSLENHRGIDIADLWNARMDVRKKLKKGIDNDISTFGLDTSPHSQKEMKGGE